MIYLEGKNLSLGYEGSPVIENINFEFKKGDYLCIIGENGVGKSTLVKAIMKLIKPISGELIYGEGIDNKQIGFLPQQTQYQKDFPATVEEIVMTGSLHKKKGLMSFYTKSDKETAARNMKRLDIYEMRKKSYRNLSGGQQQRVLLARALCQEGEILLLDEPVAGLDPAVTMELYDLIKKLNESGTSVMMVTHDMKAAEEYASHILFLGKKFKFYGTKDEFNASEYASRFFDK